MKQAIIEIDKNLQFSKYIQIDGKEISFLKKLIEKKSADYYFYPFDEIKNCDYLEITNYINRRIIASPAIASHTIDIPNDSPDIKSNIISNHTIDSLIDIKNGDIIVFSDPKELYRNAGKCAWFDGRAIPLSHLSDEYGEIPQCIEIQPNNFHPRYWIDTIHHNINYWPCEFYRMECCNNITVSANNIRYTWFIHDERKEYVVLDQEREEIISEIRFKEILIDRSNPYSAYPLIDFFLDDMNIANVSMVYPKYNG